MDVDTPQKNWGAAEERLLLDMYRKHGPDWPVIEAALPARKGVLSKWKRLCATGHSEAVDLQRYWRAQRDRALPAHRTSDCHIS